MMRSALSAGPAVSTSGANLRSSLQGLLFFVVVEHMRETWKSLRIKFSNDCTAAFIVTKTNNNAMEQYVTP